MRPPLALALASIFIAACSDGSAPGGADPDGGAGLPMDADVAPLPDLAPPPDLTPPRTLSNLRDRLFRTLLPDGASPCAPWTKLDPSARAVFLTITDRLWRSTTKDGLSMLDHIVRLYAVLGGGSDGKNCGGVDNNRLFLGMDQYLWEQLQLAQAGAKVLGDGAGKFWQKSSDLGGPHSPFNLSDETQTGTKCILLIETQESLPPTGQVHYFADGKATAFNRGSAQLPKDPYMLEFDHDYDCIHRSNPLCPGTDFQVRYTRHVGDFACDWVPNTCKAAKMGCFPDANP